VVKHTPGTVCTCVHDIFSPVQKVTAAVHIVLCIYTQQWVIHAKYFKKSTGTVKYSKVNLEK
jgi:hypothetical protein